MGQDSGPEIAGGPYCSNIPACQEHWFLISLGPRVTDYIYHLGPKPKTYKHPTVVG